MLIFISLEVEVWRVQIHSKLEGEKTYREAVKQINSNLRVLASEMGKVTAEFTKNDKSTTVLTSRNKILNEQIEKQKEKISVLKNALAQSSEKYGENDKKTNNWKVSLNKAETELSRMESSLKDVNAQMEKSKTPLDKLNTELSNQGEKLKSLQTEYKNVVLSQGKNSTEAKNLASQIKSLNNDIRDNKDKLNAAEKATEQLGDEMNNTKNQTSKLSEGFTVMKGVIANLAADAIKKLGRNLVGAVKSVVSSGIEFESAFAGVKKTVDATDEEFEQFESGLRAISTQMPTTASELSAIAEAAGQLGIKNENLLSFTETMANLGVATNMSSDEAATALARLANITGMNQQNFDRLGSSIGALGNNFATTESEVTQMALNISAAGSQVGMTEADILGVAAALSSLGLEAQGGGTAISRAIIMMANACETGSSELEYFAKAAGISTAEFQKYFAEDATGALTAFISGLGNLQDESALKFLDDMGISETRLRDALLRASNANDLFTNAIKTSNEAWNENSALTNEAQQRYATTESKVQILKNTFSEMGLTLYDKVQEPLQNAASKLTEFFSRSSESGALKDALDKLSESAGILIEGISEMVVNLLPPLMNVISWLIQNSGFLLVALGGIVSAMLAVKAANFASAIGDAFTQMKSFGSKILDVASNLDFMQIKEIALTVAQGAVTAAQWLMNAAMSANPIGLIIAAIGALVGAFILLWNNSEDFRNFWLGLWESVVSACSAAWEWISSFFTEWIPNAFSTMINWIEGNWQNLLLLIVNPFAGAFKLIYDNCEDFRIFVDNFVISVKEFFINGWNAIVSFFTQSIPQFISDVGRWIGELPSKIWEGIVGAIGVVSEWGNQLISAGASAAQALVSRVWNTICELPGRMLDIGKNLVQGLWNGISNMTSWILDKIRGFGDSIMSGIKSFFGIASPSKLFEEQIGKNLAFGLGEGFTGAMKDISKQMQNSIPTEFGVEPTLNVAYNQGFAAQPQVSGNSGITVHIENFVNNRTQDVQAFAQELEFYSRRSNFAAGLEVKRLNYCIFKEINSCELGLYMEHCPEKISPKRRDETFTVPGRHGNLTTTDGAFDSCIRSAEFIVRDERKIDEICAHFKGAGWLIFSNELDRKYKARVANQIEFSHIIRSLKRFVVEFEVQPFGYDVFEQKITKTAPFSLFNIGTFEAEPIITIFGAGNITLYVNNQSISLKGIAGSITIDSEMQNAYRGTTSMNNRMSGEFPILRLGENHITWLGNVTRLEIQPNWRYI
ncbi:MAG: phage tail tape measure protein [Acutalibacteraceae bacterium]